MGGRLTVRTRITFTATTLAAAGLAGAGLLVYVLESARIDRDVTGRIEQEIAELRTFQRSAVDPEDGTRIEDPNRLLEVFLTRNVPDDDELLVWYAGGRPADGSSEASPQAGSDLRSRNRYAEQILDDRAFVDLLDPLLAADGGTRVLEQSSFGEVWVTAVPVRRSGTTQGEGTLVIVNFLADAQRELARTMQTYSVVAVAALGVLALVAALRAGRLLAPLRTLNDAADDISANDLDRRIPETGRDDITTLTRTFNRMLDRLDASFTSQQRFLDDAGHELKTPLTVLRGHLEVLDAQDEDEVEATRDLLLDEIDRMARLVGDLILLAKTERPDFLTEGPVDLDALTRTVCAKARALGDRRWVIDEVAPTSAVLDEQRITQALLQLADNAVKHTGTGDTIAIGTRVEGPLLLAWVRDEGRGVPARDRDRIFERFGRSTVPRGDEGFGLGLSVVRAIAEAHAGHARVEDADPGARFVITVPLARPRSQDQPRTSDTDTSSGVPGPPDRTSHTSSLESTWPTS